MRDRRNNNYLELVATTVEMEVDQARVWRLNIIIIIIIGRGDLGCNEEVKPL